MQWQWQCSGRTAVHYGARPWHAVGEVAPRLPLASLTRVVDCAVGWVGGEVVVQWHCSGIAVELQWPYSSAVAGCWGQARPGRTPLASHSLAPAAPTSLRTVAIGHWIRGPPEFQLPRSSVKCGLQVAGAGDAALWAYGHTKYRMSTPEKNALARVA